MTAPDDLEGRLVAALRLVLHRQGVVASVNDHKVTVYLSPERHEVEQLVAALEDFARRNWALTVDRVITAEEAADIKRRWLADAPTTATHILPTYEAAELTAVEVVEELNRRLDTLLPPAREAYGAEGDVAEHAYSCAAWGEGQWCCLDHRDADHWDFRAWLNRQLVELLDDAQRPATTRPGDHPAALLSATAESDRSVP